MTALAKAKTIGGGFTNEEQIYRARYEFSVDGGAAGALDVFTADGDCVITDIYAVVKTTCTSGGSATVSVGVTGTAAYFNSAEAVAGLTANAILRPLLTEGTPNVSKLPVRLADGSSVIMTIATAALTAGVIEFVVKVMKI